MKQYPSYKDSGQSWVGEIPSHWELKPNRSLFRDVGKTVENEGEGFLLLSLTQNGLIPRDMENPSGKFPSDFSTYQKVAKGDLVFCLFDVDETPRTVGISSHDGMITGAYTVMRCYDDNHAKYLYWFYLSLDEAKRLKPLYRGLRKVVPAETFRSIKSPMPPRDEAAKICNFIESQVDSMNKAISSQARMIELLKERRSAIITQAVTKGIDPKAKMKDSEVQWLGQVPAHWDIKALKFVSKHNQETLSEDTDSDLELSYVEVSDVSQEAGIRSYQGIRFGEAPSRARRVMTAGEVIISTVRTYLKAIAYVGAAYDGFICSTGFCVIRPTNIDPAFAQYALASDFFMAEVVSRSTGVSYPAINASDLVRVKLAIPPPSEQKVISNYLSGAIAKVDAAISTQERMIELLKERRSAIITQAVTGQIDVR